MVFVYVWGAWGMDGGWMQRYYDPVSLVLSDFQESEDMTETHSGMNLVSLCDGGFFIRFPRD